MTTLSQPGQQLGYDTAVARESLEAALKNGASAEEVQYLSLAYQEKQAAYTAYLNAWKNANNSTTAASRPN
jgi:hypothetical protein